MRICSVEGCNGSHIAKGLCTGHYQQMKRGVALSPVRPVGEGVNFLKSLIGTEEKACILWPYWKNNKGYAMTHYEGRKVVASRLSCQFSHGLPPDATMDAAHSCGKGHLGCVNPNHLSWKTRVDNHEDKKSHGTWLHGESQNGAKMDRYGVRLARKLFALEYPLSDINLLFPFMSRGGLRDAIIGKSWSWLPSSAPKSLTEN